MTLTIVDAADIVYELIDDPATAATVSQDVYHADEVTRRAIKPILQRHLPDYKTIEILVALEIANDTDLRRRAYGINLTND